MKYGDYDNVTKDVKTLNDIIDRQGASLLIDVLAEKVGNTAIKHKLTSDEIVTVMQSMLTELKESILERT